jgi:D-cysteine desulfhydrase
MAQHVDTVESRALFARLPRLVDIVPWMPLADGLPTPVEEIDDGLYVQRDDLTDSRYGGNKVRKLEFVLPIARRRGGPVLTAGAIGSHHVYATAVHASRFGMEVEAVRFPQPDTDHVHKMDLALRALDNVRHTMIDDRNTMPFVLARRRLAVERAGGYAVLPGATSPLGVLGYVSAGLELVDAFARHGWASPDDVVVALGSGGTAVGLALGLAMGGWTRTSVVAVRVADAIVTNKAVLGVHAAGTRSLLAMGGWLPARRRPSLDIDRRYFGEGYGHPTDEGERAAEEAGRRGLSVEPTYTAKAFAAALDRWRDGRRVVYVQTYAPIPSL